MKTKDEDEDDDEDQDQDQDQDKDQDQPKPRRVSHHVYATPQDGSPTYIQAATELFESDDALYERNITYVNADVVQHRQGNEHEPAMGSAMRENVQTASGYASAKAIVESEEGKSTYAKAKAVIGSDPTMEINGAKYVNATVIDEHLQCQEMSTPRTPSTLSQSESNVLYVYTTTIATTTTTTLTPAAKVSVMMTR